jgi:hypothetical protein
MNQRHPLFPGDTRLLKSLSDWAPQNPIKKWKNAAASIKDGNGIDALHHLTGASAAVAPSVVAGTMKATFNPANEYVYRAPGTPKPTLLAPVNKAPAPKPDKPKTLLDGNGAGTSLLKA